MTDLHLYQTLHLFRGRVRLLDRHVALLDRCSRDLFGRGYAPDLRQLERRILAAAAPLHAGDGSLFVRLVVTDAGQERIVPLERSYYEGYALRSLMPAAVSLPCDLPLDGYPTPAREAAAAAARCLAARAGCDTALLYGSDGSYHSAEGSPVAAVHDYTVWLAPERTSQPIPETDHRLEAPRSVEYELLAAAAQAAGLRVEERPFGPADRKSFDELFWLDYRGITALSQLDGRPLMSLLAERVAEALEKRFRKG